MTGPPATPFLLRVWRAALLHADTYEEVEADRSAMGELRSMRPARLRAAVSSCGSRLTPRR